MCNNGCKIVRLATAVLLTIFFVANSWLIFEHYWIKKRVTSSNIMINKAGKQRMPAIVVCREKAYTNVQQDMSKLEDYLNNTLSLNYDVYDPIYEILQLNSTDLEREYVYSFTRGLCVILKYIPKVFIIYQKIYHLSKN